MHGKIAIYIDVTQRGTIVDAKKVFYDFGANTWNDKRSMPSVGMFVEFNMDAKQVTGVRPSKFQSFDEADFLNERDFWTSANDDELENIQNDRRGAYVKELYQETDWDNIEKIPLSCTIPKAIAKFFAAEILSVETLKSNINEEENNIPCILDHLIIKRFVYKALDTLLFMDNSINQNQFNSLKSIVIHLENSYERLKNGEKIFNVSKIFNDTFLSLQCHYQALVAVIDNRKNRIYSLEKQIKNLVLDLNLKKQQKTPDNEKIAGMEERLARLQKENLAYTALLKRLEALRDDFYKKNYSIFENAFRISREKLFEKTVTGLNLCSTIIDTKIWQASLKSGGVKNSYFSRSNIEVSFCGLSFAEHYLSRLNKHALNPADEKLHFYVEKIIKTQRKKFLVLTTDTELLCEIRKEVFARNPYYLVKCASQKVSFQSFMRNNVFDIIYIDEEHIWENAADIILEGKGFDKSKKAKFKLI